MKDFKKRSLVLMLASVITVTGSFAADNYKNCLMDMTFKANGANEINMVLSTKRLYEDTINPVKRDANTYVIMLPETDSAAPTPNLSEANGNIESVTVKKMPYANGSKGYTRITIKTAGGVNLNATSTLYLPNKNDKQNSYKDETNKMIEESERHDTEEHQTNPTQKTKSTSHYINRYTTEARPKGKSSYMDEEKDVNDTSNDETELTEQNNTDLEPQEEQDIQSNFNNEDNDNQKYILGLWVVLIIMTSLYFYIKAQDKLRNVLGEKLEIDVKEEEDKKKNSKNQNVNKKKISGAINKIDAMYSKTAYITPKKESIPSKINEQQEELNIVDLDALFKEQSNTAEQSTDDNDESSALDDFLSGFSFEDELPVENKEEVSTFDENVYEQILNDNELKFTDEDMICFNELLQSEISSEVMNNLAKYVVSNPIAPKKPAKDTVLANLVTDFAINQNISFSTEDISALKKLISVEIDPDFITDLKTNPKRTQEMEQELLKPKPQKIKPTKLMTLKVKDMLPNLAEELKLQGNKPIESQAKSEIVYYSEGYEVSKLKLDFDMPDLSKEINNRQAYKSKPSEMVQVVDNSYSDSVEKLSITGLPDLKDVIKNPDKYKDPEPEVFVADENSLLNSIANVQFKPFDDGTRIFEIINNDENCVSTTQTKHDDFDSTAHQEKKESFAESAIPEKPTPAKKRETKQTLPIQKLLNKEQTSIIKPQHTEKKPQKQEIKKAIVNNTAFNIVDSAEIDKNTGCYLAKSNASYVVLSYKGQETEVIKEYDSVKSEKIQVRIHETLPDGTPRYLIRVGANKLVADLKDGKLIYVMDLC